MRRLVGAALALSVISMPAAYVQMPLTPYLVERENIVRAMLRQQAENYNILATANGARFSSGVILALAHEARDRDPDRRPILIDHREYFAAYLEVTGLPADRAPTFMRIAVEHGEDQYVDYRHERVVARMIKGATPHLAVNVVAGWPDGPGVPEKYSYEDRTASPALRVTHRRINSYRILDYGDMIVYDDVRGVSGRALGGLLGAVFTVIGDGQAVRSFMAVSKDGLQVTLTTAKKGFLTITQEAIVHPNGRAEKGVPRDRPDLLALERRLRQAWEAEYVALGNMDPTEWRTASRTSR